MFPLSTAASNAIRGSHTVTVRATAYSAHGGQVPDLPVTSGVVTIDSRSQTRRTATVGFGDADLWPEDAFSILSPIGSELMLEAGIVLSSGIEWIPLIYGPIVDTSRNRPSDNTAAIEVKVADRSLKIAEARFDQPTQTIAGATTVAEISRLITDVLPTVSVVDTTGSTKVAPQLDMERERWADGVEKLADSIGAEVFADATGNFIIRAEPDITDPVVWVVTAGDGGILITESDQYSRDLVYNRVVASGQRVDGTPPVFAVSSDNVVTSPTYIGGPFGVKTRFYASPLLTTIPQCQSAADSFLARVTGRHLNVSFDTIVNPALEAGDILQLVIDGRSETHIIDQVSIPLTPGATQQIKTRSLDLPSEV
jgi:hypothetical protein